METLLNDFISKEFGQTSLNMAAMQGDAALHRDMERVVDACLGCLRDGGKILFAGNGGSAADSQHLAGEMVSRFNYDRPGLSAFALSTDTSVLTAIGNDYGYELLFARQIEAVGKVGDVFIGISTSGRSPNILKALATARSMGLITVGLTGRKGGDLPPLCDYCLYAPADETPRIQECHIAIGHTICAMIEMAMFPRA